MEDNLLRLAILLGLMALLAALEALIPFRQQTRGWKQQLRPNLLLTALFFVMNIVLTAGIVDFAALLQQQEFGILHLLPDGIAMVVAIVLLDFFAYLAHVLMHRMPWLWRVHRVHHSDEAVDVTTAFRQHPLETMLRFAFTSIPAILLGASPTATAAYRLLSGMNALLEHSNIGLNPLIERWVNLVFVTPQAHKVHHDCRSVYTDSNYANIFSVFDRLFGTRTSSEAGSAARYGLDLPGSAHRSFRGLLKLPFTSAVSLSPPADDPSGLSVGVK